MFSSQTGSILPLHTHATIWFSREKEKEISKSTTLLSIYADFVQREWRFIWIPKSDFEENTFALQWNGEQPNNDERKWNKIPKVTEVLCVCAMIQLA